MNTPVSFEIAKLLKEKGFDEPCKRWACLDGNCVAMSYDAKTCVKMPTIGEVAMWFYEKHQMWINIHCTEGVKSFWYEIRGVGRIWFIGKNHNSPTEAYEAAFTHLLNNVI